MSKNGDIVSFTVFSQVQEVTNDGSLIVKNLDDGTVFKVQGSKLLEKLKSSDEFKETKKVAKTEMAQMVSTAFGVPFTVEFEKADGSNRTMRARLLGSEPIFGRSMVDDLDLPASEHRQRQIDHRTLKSLVLNGVKYVLKK